MVKERMFVRFASGARAWLLWLCLLLELALLAGGARDALQNERVNEGRLTG